VNNQHGLSTVDLMIVAAAFFMVAALAVPRFAFLSEEARVDSVRNLAEDVRASAELTYRVWDSAGRPKTLRTSGETLELAYGFPTKVSVGAVVMDDSEFLFDNGVWHFADKRKKIENCFVSYEAPRSAAERPLITANVDGC